MDVHSTELGIWLSFGKTSEFRGGGALLHVLQVCCMDMCFVVLSCAGRVTFSRLPVICRIFRCTC
jgi:hypothetical protein